MKFSVIIPVYNVEKYLEKCLLSVLNQTFQDFQIIIVIDGATDGSESIARRIKMEHPQADMQIIVQKNKGLGGARNTGMEYAAGDYWFFIDSDDYLAANALEILDRATEDDKYDMVYFNSYVVNEQGKVLQKLNVQPPQEKDTSLAESPELLQTYPAAWNKLYKRTLFHEGIRYQEKKWFEDLDVALKLYLKAERVLFIDDILYYYVQRKGSIMSDGNVVRNMEMLDIFDSICDYYKEHNAYEKYRNEIEYLAIWKILILVMGRINMTDANSELQGKLVDYMEEHFPDYRSNPYLVQMDAEDKERVMLAADRKFDHLYKKYARKDKFKKVMKFLIPGWMARFYYSRK